MTKDPGSLESMANYTGDQPGKDDEDSAPAFDIGEDEELLDLVECDDAKSKASTCACATDSSMKCFLCLEDYRTKSQICCCAPCAADVRGAQRDAASQGPQAKTRFHAISPRRRRFIRGCNFGLQSPMRRSWPRIPKASVPLGQVLFQCDLWKSGGKRHNIYVAYTSCFHPMAS